MTSPEANPTAAPARRACEVLLVEDHVDTATVITLLLKKFGHRVEAATTVADGLCRFRAGKFDIVLSDLGLPDGSGFDFIRQVRAESTVPAIALTGYGMEDDIRACRDAGFDAHLTKPVNFTDLDAAIGRLTAPKV